MLSPWGGGGLLVGILNEAIRTQVRPSPQINGLWLSIWTSLMEKKPYALSLQELDLYLQFRICVFIQFCQYQKKKKRNALISKSDIWILSHDLVCLLSKTTVSLGHLPSTTTCNTSNQGEKQPQNKPTKNHL